MRRTFLLWLPTFLGFPAGGLAAELVGRVDSPAPAIAGGAITGAILGAAQWLGMRRTGPHPIGWVVATAAGFAAGLGLGAAAAGYQTDTASLALQGLVCGAIVGLAQAPLLHRLLGRVAFAWPPFIAGLWALGWTITAAIGVDVDAQYTTFGSSGALVVTAATSILPILLQKERS